jgi:DNA-binding transcriptional LysR family regulator
MSENAKSICNNRKLDKLMLRELEVFLAVVEGGNFSAAARQMDQAVSSVTRRIDTLEQELNVQLLRRGNRNVVLTDAGVQFLDTARRMVAEFSEAREVLSNSGAEPRGLITIAAPSAFGRRHVAPAIQGFLQQYPHIDICLHANDALIDLNVERVDFAIRIGRLPDSDLIARQIAPLRRLVCAAPSYIKRAGSIRTPKDLLEHECLTVASRPTPVGWWTFAGINRGAPLPVKGRLQSDDTEILLGAAVAGMGVVHLATWMVGDLIREGKLVSMLPEQPRKRNERVPAIYAVHLPGRSHKARAQLFLDYVVGHFGSPPYWDRTAMARSVE